MLRDLWLGQPDHLDEVVDGAFPAREDVQDLASPWLRHRVERIGGRRSSSHGKIIYPYGNISTGVSRTNVRLKTWRRQSRRFVPALPGGARSAEAAEARPHRASPGRSTR